MQLSTEEVAVRGDGEDGWRLHDYVIARLELRAVDTTVGPESAAVFAVVTLGDLGTSASNQMHTNVFGLSEIPECPALRRSWKEAHARGQCERGFLDYLLRFLWANRDPHLEFLVEGNRMTRFALVFDQSIRLAGRCPEDVDILDTYFGVVLAQTD